MKEKENSATLTKVADTITEKYETLDIDIKPRNKIHAWLMKRKLAPTMHHFEIKPQRVVNVYRIAGRAIKINIGNILSNEERTIIERLKDFMEIMANHGDDIIYIVAAAIQNNHKEPSKHILDIVKNDLEVEDLEKVLYVALANYNIISFSNSIALIKGVDTLKIKKASPTTKGV